MLCSLVITIPGLLVIAFYGSFADRYGLKQTLLVPVVGNFLYCGCILLAMWPSFSPYYVYVLLLGSLCSGLSGIPFIRLDSTRLQPFWSEVWSLLLTLTNCMCMSGSRNSFIMASFTYAAVSSPASERSEVFSFIESAIFSARIIGESTALRCCISGVSEQGQC